MEEAVRRLTTPDGAVLVYRVLRGNAPRRLLVLIHGLASNLSRWSEFVERTALKESWDILRLNLRGHGGALWRGRITMETWSDDLAAILDKEGYETAVVGGHCLGAHAALWFAARYPERTAGLVLIEPLPRAALSEDQKKGLRFLPLLTFVIPMIQCFNGVGLRRKHFPVLDLQQLDQATRQAMSSAGTTQPLLRRYAAPWHDLRYLPSANYLQGFRELHRELPSLSGIRQPVLTLLSTGKRFSDPEATQRIFGRLPHGAVKVLDSHHWIPTERPDAMREAIENWCRELALDQTQKRR